MEELGEVYGMRIEGVFTLPTSMNEEDFQNRFLHWVDSNGWHFGGSVWPYEEEEEEGK